MELAKQRRRLAAPGKGVNEDDAEALDDFRRPVELCSHQTVTSRDALFVIVGSNRHAVEVDARTR
jgi:hypothetical protein